MQIRLHPKAEQDLNEALNHYLEIDSNLEKKFVIALDDTFNKIVKFPNMYQYETQTSQKIVMDKFPFVVMYEQYEEDVLKTIQ